MYSLIYCCSIIRSFKILFPHLINFEIEHLNDVVVCSLFTEIFMALVFRCPLTICFVSSFVIWHLWLATTTTKTTTTFADIYDRCFANHLIHGEQWTMRLTASNPPLFFAPTMFALFALGTPYTPRSMCVRVFNCTFDTVGYHVRMPTNML